MTRDRMNKPNPADPDDLSGAPASDGLPKRRKRLAASVRREQILKAAQQVFIRSGLGGSRTRELAREAGVNEATLFTHFKTKEDLFDAAVVEPLERLVENEMNIDGSYRRATSQEEQHRLNLEAHKRLLDTIREIYPLLVTALFSDSERGRQFYRSHLYPWFQSLVPSIRDSYGGRHRNKELDPQFLQLIGVGAYLALVMDHNFRDAEIDPEKMIRTVSTLFASGVYEP
ncbi:TetR/AcrR family transcriptional regulator [Emcibacter sp. SYSU 3D8]|uniref:TetR/AcrR family transcriptional regulator n=1 Tax=Emcibacter sp. SYSU 3D8 TaxID=3133969 RepID=UPI0031FF31A1